VRKPLLATCTVAALGFTGCQPFDVNREVAKIEAAVQADPIFINHKACIEADYRLNIGDSMHQARPCVPDRIHTTETAHGTRKQWVIQLDGGNEYLYFENDKLVAKQEDE
jgi:hypothetical protein